MPLPEFKQLVDEASSQISEIGPNDLRRMQQSGEDFTLVDVRERDEQAKGIIPGAVSLPRGILEVDVYKRQSLKRSLVASEKRATAMPVWVYFTSGSFPRLPMRMTLLTLLAMRTAPVLKEWG